MDLKHGPLKDKQMQNPSSKYKIFKKLLSEKQEEGAYKCSS
jgi:hypothetical protein